MQQTQKNVYQNNDILLVQPADTISSVAWSPAPDNSSNTGIIHHLAASTWDGNLLWYRVSLSGQFESSQTPAHKAPILDVSWAIDGSKVFSSSCDKTVMAWDFGAQQGVQVAEHNDGVKFVRHVQTGGGQMLVTGGWDNYIKWWDGNSNQPVHIVDMKAPAHCASFNDRIGVVCTTNRRVLIFDLQSGFDPVLDIESPIAKFATRSVSVFPGSELSFALGSVDGRVCLLDLAIRTTSSNNKNTQYSVGGNFTFKCHREDVIAPSGGKVQVVYPVNSIATYNKEIFSTSGSNGVITFWNKRSKSRVGGEFIARHQSPITSSAFSSDLNLFAYAAGYDWHQGIESSDPKTFPNALYVHGIVDGDKK